MKTFDSIINQHLLNTQRAHFNPIHNLRPESLTRILDAFHNGHIAQASLLWEAIERRDDIVKNVASKRKKAIAHLPWEILTIDNSTEAIQHKTALQAFYNNITVTNALDKNETGGFSLLVKQMLDAVGKKYAVHEIIYKKLHNKNHLPLLSATFQFVPLWLFENTSGKLKLQTGDPSKPTLPLSPNSWLITTAEGLMEATSIAYLYKHLPLRDWLVYCGRNGTPGIKAVTDAAPNSTAWQTAFEAVENFSNEFRGLMSRGTDILPIDLSTKGELPYPALIERMDRAIASLWRGADLATLSKETATGSSIQNTETVLIEKDDALLVSETLNAQVDRTVLQELFNVQHGKAYIKIGHNKNHTSELSLYKELHALGIPIPTQHLLEKFGIPINSKN